MGLGLDYETLASTLRSTLESLSRLKIERPSIEIQIGTPVIRGGFGDIRRAKLLREDGPPRDVALKELRAAGNRNQRLRVAVALARELRVWSDLDHPNIIKLLGFYLDDEYEVAQLLSPWEPLGNVMKYLKDNDPDEGTRLRLALDTAKGLEYLHMRNPAVRHGDVKGANVLVTREKRAMWCDFGLAQIEEDIPSGLTTSQSMRGTARYLSPELLKSGGKTSIRSDVWAWGCVFMEIMTGTLPYETISTKPALIRAISRGKTPIAIEKYYNLDIQKEIALRCWSPDPESRPTMTWCSERLYDRLNEFSRTDLGTSQGAEANNPGAEANINLGSLRFKSYKVNGNLEVLEEGIRALRQALQLAPYGHSSRDICLDHLGLCLLARYDRMGDPAETEEAFVLLRKSLDLRPRGHPLRGTSLSSLGTSLAARFEREGRLEDLEDAIELQRECVELRPASHPLRPVSLSHLGTTLFSCFKAMGSPAHLEEAICFHRECLNLIPTKHPTRATVLSNLGMCYATRFDRTNNMQDLADAINLQNKCLELSSLEHPDRSRWLSHLANTLLRQLRDSANYLERNITMPAEPSGSEVGDRFLGPFASGQTLIMDNVFELLQEATLHSFSATHDRISAANRWRNLARKHAHPSELLAMRETLNLLDLAAAEASSAQRLSHRLAHEEMFRGAQGVASEAAALAIQEENVDLAISLLEQGRSIIFAQLSRYRPVIDDVREISPELAVRLVDLGVELDALVFRGERVGPNSNAKMEYLDDNASRHYTARTAWTNTVEEIRRLPGLESFLLPSPFERLQEAASEGPVVIVNINKRRSDAIIVYSKGNPTLVSLPDASPDAVQNIVDGFGERPAECTPRKATSLLSEIWMMIVQPVVAHLLEALEHSDKPRIWWCPAGVASKLPLHAAGPYKRGEKNFGHLFVSSYTPTLGTLIRTRQARGNNRTGEESTKSILIVGQPETPGENPLPKVVDEVLAIKKQAPHASILLSSDGTKEAVLNGVRENAWLHLICHGRYDLEHPFMSSFSLHDGRITLLDLVGKDLPNAELAFLSACYSARASEALPDEALHPAAGLLFAGFKSVIGTMWAFDDEVGCALGSRFYQLMVEGNKGYSDAAVTLADAMEDIVAENKGCVPFMQRINVVHYGA